LAAAASALPPREPSYRGPQAPRHNLPVEITSFVGRERELAEIRQILGQTHLLTLTGTGGCGKTRLALKLGETVLENYPDGVWLVELAPLADPALIPQTVAAAVGVHEIAGRDLTSVLVDGLRARRLLIILDNCEHLIEDCARLVEALLRNCPQVQIVATSREILGATGETVWRVPSLPVLDPRELPRTSAELVTAASDSAAIRLFAERAWQVSPGFMITPENATPLAQICFRLDGIPLAIELAAARVRTLSVGQLATRLDNRFRLLTGGSRTALRRQQTLQALVDWSYDLLPPKEQVFFRRLAVFAGGWQLEAAEEVGSDEGIGFQVSGVGGDGRPDTRHLKPDTQQLILRDEVLDLLTALADKSLVVVDNSAGGEPRYRLLETLREYAMERLARTEEAEAVHRAHATHYRVLGEHEQSVATFEAFFWTRRFLTEIDNVRAALRWADETEDWESFLSLFGSLAPYWALAGHLEESRALWPVAAQHLTTVAPIARARALYGLGRLAFGRSDYLGAETYLRESIGLFRELGDQRMVANTLGALGNALRDASKLDEAIVALQEAIELDRILGLPVLGNLFQLGVLARQQGKLDEAKQLLLHALRQAEPMERPEDSIVVISFNLGLVAEDASTYAEASTWFAQSARLVSHSGFRWHQPYNLEGLATLAFHQDQPERCLVLTGAAATAREQLGSPMPSYFQERLNQALEPARAQLGAEAAASAWAKGRAMSLEEAFAYALGDEGR
jgi:non-specific serine/threonine protein kinase